MDVPAWQIVVAFTCGVVLASAGILLATTAMSRRRARSASLGRGTKALSGRSRAAYGQLHAYGGGGSTVLPMAYAYHETAAAGGPRGAPQHAAPGQQPWASAAAVSSLHAGAAPPAAAPPAGPPAWSPARAGTVAGAASPSAAPAKPAIPAVYLDETANLDKYSVVAGFAPRRKGEIALAEGDLVLISMVFTDGMAHGFNPRTQEAGLCPLANMRRVPKAGTLSRKTTHRKHSERDAVPGALGGASHGHGLHGPTAASPEPPADDADAILVPEDSDNADSILAPEDSDAEADGGDNDADAVASPTEDEKQMWLRQFEEMRSSQQRGDQSKLLFSMVPREQAMAIVTDAMPADVRREYFARSMAGARQSFSGASTASSAAGAAGGVVDGDADGELDGGDTAAAVRRASVASSAASADVRRGRAQLAWSLLRANWRDAVAAELDAGYNEYLQSRRKFDFWQFVFDTTVTQPTA